MAELILDDGYDMRALNLSVLQKHDKSISDVVASSSHAVIYRFDMETREWVSFYPPSPSAPPKQTFFSSSFSRQGKMLRGLCLLSKGVFHILS